MSTRPPASCRVQVVLSPRDRLALDEAARRDERSISALVRRIVRDYLRTAQREAL